VAGRCGCGRDIMVPTSVIEAIVHARLLLCRGCASDPTLPRAQISSAPTDFY
jgi:hypothetical protein